jgi:hypothetical protein
MATNRKDLETRLIATDQASKVIDKVADRYDDIPDTVDTTIRAEDKATPQLRTIVERLEGLSKEDQMIVLEANARDAQREIDRILKALGRVHDMDDEEVQVRIEALDKAKGDLDRVQAEIRDLDGETATVNVESPGLDDMLGKLESLPGHFGELGSQIAGVAGKIGAGGAVGVGVTALVGGLIAAADQAKEIALQAQTMAKLTGATVEESSKLQQVWSTTGADVNDLNDIVVQLNGALAQSPDLASKLGINLGDGRDAVARLVQVLDLADQGLVSMTDQSTLFGEEGIRQVAALTSQYDDLTGTIEAMPAPVTKEDAAQALELERAMKEVQTTINRLVLTIGEAMIPLLEEAADKAADIAPQVEPGVTGLAELLGLLGKVAKTLETIGVEPFKFEVDPRTLDFWEQPLNPFAIPVNSADLAITKAKDLTEALFGPDLKGRSVISDEGARRQEDAARLAIAAGREQAGVADQQARAAKDQLARLGIAVSRITAAHDVQTEINDRVKEHAELLLDVVTKIRSWEKSIDDIKIALDDAMTPFEDGTAAADAFREALDKIGLSEGLDTLDRLGDQSQALQDVFAVIKENEGVIPNIFKTGRQSSRDMRDALADLGDTYRTELLQVLEDSGGEFDKVRDKADEMRLRLAASFAEKLGLDLTVDTDYDTVVSMVDAVIPSDKEIELGIKLAEKDLIQLKADLAIAQLEKLLPATALQLKVDMAEGEIGPREAAATAQTILDQNGVEVDLGVDTSKANTDLTAFAAQERSTTMGVIVPDTALQEAAFAIDAGPGGRGWPPVVVDVVPNLNSSILERAGGGPVPRNSLVRVGEHGPETLALPGGSYVYPHGVNPASGGRGAPFYNVNVSLNAAVIGAPHDVARAVEGAMRRATRLNPVRP